MTTMPLPLLNWLAEARDGQEVRSATPLLAVLGDDLLDLQADPAV
jgi:hypothetical protein